MAHPSVCPHCRVLLRPPPIGVGALFEYDGVGRALVLAAKTRHRRDLLVRLGGQLSILVPDGIDEITWVPASTPGRRHRGEDQAEVLARALGRVVGRPVRRRLRRSERRSRKGLDREERLDGIGLSARPGAGRVVVVDDVVTTGASLDSAVAALSDAGACLVVPIAVAAVPRPSVVRRVSAM